MLRERFPRGPLAAVENTIRDASDHVVGIVVSTAALKLDECAVAAELARRWNAADECPKCGEVQFACDCLVSPQ